MCPRFVTDVQNWPNKILISYESKLPKMSNFVLFLVGFRLLLGCFFVLFFYDWETFQTRAKTMGLLKGGKLFLCMCVCLCEGERFWVLLLIHFNFLNFIFARTDRMLMTSTVSGLAFWGQFSVKKARPHVYVCVCKESYGLNSMGAWSNMIMQRRL